MLVLSRKLNESITIGENISVKVIRVQGGRVRLAIEAPDHIRIARSEIEFEVDAAREPDSRPSTAAPFVQSGA